MTKVAIDRELLEHVKDLCDYWFTRENRSAMSESEYKNWHALGFGSNAFTELCALLAAQESSKEDNSQASASQSAPAGEREAFELASVDDSFGSLRALGAEAERRGLEDGDYIDFAARKAWEYFKAGAAWQRTQSAGVPEGYVWVPAEPTVEMLRSCRGYGISDPRVMEMAWKRMLAAALADSTGQEVDYGN